MYLFSVFLLSCHLYLVLAWEGMGCKGETYCGQKAGGIKLLRCSGQSQPSAGVQQALECHDMILWLGQFSTSFSSAGIT